MFYTNNPIADFERYDREREKALAKLPVCSECGNTIQEDFYDFGGDYICEDCLSNHKKRIEDYI